MPRREAPSKEAPSKEAHVRGRVARVWAQGESGEKYTTYRHKDLDLVPPNAQYNNRRVYYGEETRGADVRDQADAWSEGLCPAACATEERHARPACA